MTTDGSGGVYVAGRSASQTGNRELVTIKYADSLFYSPPRDFVGLDAVTCTLADSFGNTATGLVEVIVTPNTFHFSNPSKSGTPTGLQLLVEGVPGSKAVVLEISLDLMNWRAILTNNPQHGSAQFLIPRITTNSAQGFYRAVQGQ